MRICRVFRDVLLRWCRVCRNLGGGRLIDPSIAIGLKAPRPSSTLPSPNQGQPTPCPQLAQGFPDPAVPYGSAYWGAPAAHTRAREVVGAAESDPNRPCRL